MTVEPRWLSVALVREFHRVQLEEFGGPAGVRDEGALDSALGRLRNRFAYEGAELPELAAAYAYGLERNHPFGTGTSGRPCSR